MIVLLADAIAVAVLALTVWVLNGAHLPLDLPHTLAAQAVTAVVAIVAVTEAHRAHTRRRTTTNGDTHS